MTFAQEQACPGPQFKVCTDCNSFVQRRDGVQTFTDLFQRMTLHEKRVVPISAVGITRRHRLRLDRHLGPERLGLTAAAFTLRLARLVG